MGHCSHQLSVAHGVTVHINWSMIKIYVGNETNEFSVAHEINVKYTYGIALETWVMGSLFTQKVIVGV